MTRKLTPHERTGLINTLIERSLGFDLLTLQSVGERFGLHFDKEELEVLETYYKAKDFAHYGSLSDEDLLEEAALCKLYA